MAPNSGLIAMNAIGTRKERMRRALWRQPVDRLPVQTNYTAAMGRKLREALGIDASELSRRLDNHLLRVDVGHTTRLSDDGKVGFDWWGTGWDTRTEGYWNAVSPLADSRDLDRFPWPDPDAPGLLDEAAAAISADGGEHFVAPNFGMCLFERAWSLRGFTAFLMDLVDDPEWAAELLDRITDIQVRLAPGSWPWGSTGATWATTTAPSAGCSSRPSSGGSTSSRGWLGSSPSSARPDCR